MESYRAEAAAFLENFERRDWKAAVDQFNDVDAKAKIQAGAFKHEKNVFMVDRRMFELCLKPSGARPPSSIRKALNVAEALRKKHNPRLDELGALCDKNLGLLEEVLRRQENGACEQVDDAPALEQILAQIETEKNLLRGYDAENGGGMDEDLIRRDEEACDNSQARQELEMERALSERHQNSMDSEGAARSRSLATLVKLRASLGHIGRCVEVMDLRHDFIKVNIRTVVDVNARSSPPQKHAYTHTLTVGLTGHSMNPVDASLVPQDLRPDDITAILNAVQNEATDGRAVFSLVEQVVEILSYKMERKSVLDGVARVCPIREIGVRGTEFRVVQSNGVEAEIEIPRSWPRNPNARLRVLAAQHPSVRVELDAFIKEFNATDLVRSGLRDFLAGFTRAVSQSQH